MAKTFSKRFYNSTAWQSCRASFISYRQSIDGGLCQHCGEKIGTIVHHTEILTEENINNPFIALNHEKLELVCLECHNKLEGHGLNKGVEIPCEFDTEGNLLPPSEA